MAARTNLILHAVVVTVSQDRVPELIIQVDRSDELEDALEKPAVGEVDPGLFEHRLLVVPVDAIPLVIFVGMFYILRNPQNQKRKAS